MRGHGEDRVPTHADFQSAGTAPGDRAGRVFALIRRYFYLLTSSWPRLLELVYWPLVQMLMWGFLQTFLAGETSLAYAVVGGLVGALLLWDALFRAQLGMSLTFLEEIWSRNMGHLMMSPLRVSELVAGLIVMSLVRVTIGLVPVTFLALWFFGFNLWELGLALPVFLFNLFFTSWSIALVVCGLILRYGLGAESLAWYLTFLLLPITCVYYPLDTLPEWLQWISVMLAPTHVFEGMRGVLLEGQVDWPAMGYALVLNCLYLFLGIVAFLRLLAAAQRRGALLQSGE